MATPRLTFTILALAGFAASPVSAQEPPIQGAWSAERYLLKDGIEHRISGHIFFDRHEWTVLFFVHDGAGTPRRGSAEGGTYTLDGPNLVFSHLYNLSVGDSLPGLPASPLRMEARARGSGAQEPSTVEVRGDQLMLFFPSGNSMSFRRVP